MKNRIMLGTAQFGQKYGIASGYKQVSQTEVLNILNLSRDNAITWIDTAGVYGSAEQVLGAIEGISEFNIVTKVHLGQGKDPPEKMIDRVKKSIEDLRVSSIYGVLAHDPRDLLKEGRRNEVFKTMYKIKDLGLVKKIGVSVASPEQADEISRLFNIDLIQIPCNIIDQRFVKSGTINRLVDRGVEIHARSIFLQGLLLMDSEKLDPYFNEIRDSLTGLKSYATEQGVSVRKLAIEYAKSVAGVDRIIFGTDSAEQLAQIITDYHHPFSASKDFDKFCINDERFIVPSNWKNNKN